MSICLRGAYALLIGAMCTTTSLAQSTNQNAVKALFDGVTDSSGTIQQTSGDYAMADYGSSDMGYSDMGSCGTGACDLGPCGVGGGMLGRGQFFVGGEYLHVRGNLSEATAYRETDFVNDLETFHQFDMDYGDSYRAYAGYRLCDCGGEVRFTYTNFDTEGGFNSGPNPNDGIEGRTFYGPYEVNLGEGDELVGRSSIDIESYDIAFSKTIPLGCPLSNDGCSDCGNACDPCGCGPVCPAWDITWTGGVRVANVDSSQSYQAIRAPANSAIPAGSATSRVDFDGVGLRFGLLGRRYFGRSGMLSAYVKGDISLLLGDVDYSVQGDPGFTDVALSSTQLVPVTEIEAGLTGYLTQNISVSGGYMLSAWHDLGNRAEYIYSVSPSQIYSMDDANILSLDGFFLRAEAAF